MFGWNQFISFYITLFFVFFNVCVCNWKLWQIFDDKMFFSLSFFLCSIDWLIWNHQMSGSIDDDDVFGIIIEFQIFFWFLFFFVVKLRVYQISISVWIIYIFSFSLSFWFDFFVILIKNQPIGLVQIDAVFCVCVCEKDIFGIIERKLLTCFFGFFSISDDDDMMNLDTCVCVRYDMMIY